MVDTFDAAVTTRGVGACRKFVYAEGKGVRPSYAGVRCKPWLVFLPWCCVDTFDATVTTRGVGACREFVYTDKFVNGCRRLGAACS